MDRDGKIIVKPMTGWATVPMAGIAVLLAIRYVETPEGLEIGDSKSIQLGILPQQCLELGEAMTALAKKLLEEPLPPGTHLN
jgi:hypothetical protein